jgi:hypothetical protein
MALFASLNCFFKWVFLQCTCYTDSENNYWRGKEVGYSAVMVGGGGGGGGWSQIILLQKKAWGFSNFLPSTCVKKRTCFNVVKYIFRYLHLLLAKFQSLILH